MQALSCGVFSNGGDMNVTIFVNGRDILQFLEVLFSPNFNDIHADKIMWVLAWKLLLFQEMIIDLLEEVMLERAKQSECYRGRRP
jgi:hypothetical protein